MSGGEIFFVSGEPLWPSTHGGRIRGARVVEEIARRLPVRVVAPLDCEPELAAPFAELPAALPPPRLAAIARLTPQLGQVLFDRRRQAVLAELVARHRPRVLLFAQGYLAAMVPAVGSDTVVDFMDVEVRRRASLAGQGGVTARVVHRWESTKARRWEPAVARRCLFCTASTDAEATLLSSWGAKALLVPHGADVFAPTPSPAQGPVTYVASFGYGPNQEGARFVVDELWPRLRSAEPGLRLRLVGRQADRVLGQIAARPGIEVVGDPDSVEPYYREASVILAPVEAGGGGQLKVTEALARGRIVVASPYSARSAPREARGAVVICASPDEYAARVLHLWRHPQERHEREAALVQLRPVPTWEETCAPLVEELAAVSSGA
jgi:hypothetical protein